MYHLVFCMAQEPAVEGCLPLPSSRSPLNTRPHTSWLSELETSSVCLCESHEHETFIERQLSSLQLIYEAAHAAASRGTAETNAYLRDRGSRADH